jgi:hypothetical protein
MLIELLLFIFFLLLIFIPGTLLSIIFNKRAFINNQVTWWHFPWIGTAFLVLLSINTNIGKTALFKGGYGLDWFKGIYIIAFILVTMTLWLIITSKMKQIVNVILKLCNKSTLVIYLFFCSIFLIIVSIHSLEIDTSNIIDVSNKIILSSGSQYKSVIQNNDNGLAVSVLYSLISWGSNSYQHQISQILPATYIMLLIFTIYKYIVNQRDINIRIMVIILMLINIYFHFSVERFNLSDILFMGILIQIIHSITRISIKIRKNDYKSILSLEGEVILNAVSIIGLVIINHILACTFILVMLAITGYYSYLYKNSSYIKVWLSSTFIAMLLNPFVFGVGLLGTM